MGPHLGEFAGKLSYQYIDFGTQASQSHLPLPLAHGLLAKKTDASGKRAIRMTWAVSAASLARLG